MTSVAEISAHYPALGLLARVEAQAAWYDGPGIARWLEARVYIPEADRRMLRRWRNGTAARLETVDRLLTGSSYGLADVPAELVRERPAYGYVSPHNAETRARAADEYRASGPPGRRRAAEIAGRYGVTPATLRRWATEGSRDE